MILGFTSFIKKVNLKKMNGIKNESNEEKKEERLHKEKPFVIFYYGKTFCDFLL